jgi:hypothetical protein
VNGNVLTLQGAGIVNKSGTTQTITNLGGDIQFFVTSTAGNATITSNGGTNGGLDGYTQFFDSSDGGTARAATNGNGSFDISRLTTVVSTPNDAAVAKVLDSAVGDPRAAALFVFLIASLWLICPMISY